jgi:uncharacterized phage protein (TIGR01671 family)
MIPRFRAWLKNDKKMIEVDEIHFYNGQLDFIGDGITFMRTVDKIELMQSTGLKDRNGKEIFEGDILAVETDDEVINVKVFWDKKHALYMFESKKFNEEELLAELAEDNAYPFEVIGNIHENPELLEEKE